MSATRDRRGSKYTIVNHPNNSYMQARKDITPGDIILCEAPLASLPVSLHDFGNRAEYLNPDADPNGEQSLLKMRSNLNLQNRRALDALFNKDPRGGIVSQVATNAFTSVEERDGYDHKVLRIYDRISRVNHSCRPNTSMSWHPKEEKAYLRALSQINNGDEITISYYTSEDFTLSPWAQRQQELRTEYNFTCRCPDCNLVGAERTANDNLRATAVGHLNTIKQPYPARFRSSRH